MRFFKLVVLLFLCVIFSGCGNIDIATDVQTEQELLSIMKESGKYYFYETFDEEDFLGLFCNIDDEAAHEDVISSDADISVNPESAEIEYVLNTSSRKFHLPECDSVSKIKEANISKSYERDAIISAGYNPCKICNP